MTNTFIQFPAERTSSLEQFLQPRCATSCPASRAVSLEDEPEYTASSPMNDMLIQWPATRGPSLDEEEEAGKFTAQINTAVWSALTPLPVSAAPAAAQAPQASQAPPPRWASIEDEDQAATLSEVMNQPLTNHFGNTFSQRPATRGPSLQKDLAAICNSVESHNHPCAQWPATRGPSLEEFIEAKEQDPLVLADASREEAVAWPSTRGPSLDEFIEANAFPLFPNPQALTALPAMAQSNELRFMQWAPMTGPCAEAFTQGPNFNKLVLDGKSHSMFQDLASDASTNDGDEEVAMSTPPLSVSDDEGEKECCADQSGTLKISLTDSLGLWSVGSVGHDIGMCKPCAFLWKDPQQPGCQNGRDCVFCHLCPPGEVKKRKTEKKIMRKMNRNFRYQNQVWNGFESQFQRGNQDQNQIANAFEGCEFDSPGQMPNGFDQCQNGVHFGGW